MTVGNKEINKEIMSVRELMLFFDADRETIYRLRRKGILKLFKVGGKLYARKEDIERVIGIGEKA